MFCVLLLLVQLIIGICPNNCNSHGICGKNGVCQCYHQDITQLSPNSNEVYGYEGADCSEGIYFIVSIVTNFVNSVMPFRKSIYLHRWY